MMINSSFDNDTPSGGSVFMAVISYLQNQQILQAQQAIQRQLAEQQEMQERLASQARDQRIAERRMLAAREAQAKQQTQAQSQPKTKDLIPPKPQPFDRFRAPSLDQMGQRLEAKSQVSEAGLRLDARTTPQPSRPSFGPSMR